MIHSQPLIPSKFGLNTKKSSETLPVRTVEVDSDEPSGSHGYEESVRLACRAAKKKNNACSKKFLVRMRGRSATRLAVEKKIQARMAKENDTPNRNE